MSTDKVGDVEHADQSSLDDLQKQHIEDEVPRTSELAEVLAKEKPGKSDLSRSRCQIILTRSSIDPWSRCMIRLYGIVFVAYLCSATNGFDSNTFGGASAMTSFQDFFDVDGGSKQGLLAAAYVIGNMVR